MHTIFARLDSEENEQETRCSVNTYQESGVERPELGVQTVVLHGAFKYALYARGVSLLQLVVYVLLVHLPTRLRRFPLQEIYRW